VASEAFSILTLFRQRMEALERAAGLKRESRKLPRDVVVIDRAEREATPI
jgi:uncharacterized protein (TIGR03435 family)